MRERKQDRVEAVVDRAAAVVLSMAVAVSLSVIQGGVASPKAAALPLAAAACSYLLASRLLQSVKPARPRFAVPAFTVRPFDLDQPEELLLTEQVELVLTDADRLAPVTGAADELVLDDILAKLGPQSRVVRLFDPAAMPTPGQLNARIEWHLQGSGTPAPAPAFPDASDALLQALSELRRSLR